MASVAPLGNVVVGSAGAPGVVGARSRPLRQLRRQLREARRRNRWLEERCQQIVKTADAAFLAFDAEGSVIDWNLQAERRFGWSRGDIVGRSVFETILPPPFGQAELATIRPTDEGADAPLLGRLLYVTARHREGDEFVIELHIWATRFGDSRTYNALAHDPVAPEVPGKSSCQMGAIIESSGEAIIGTDLEGNVLTWNHAAEEMFGYPSTEAVDKPIFVIVPPAAHDALAGSLLAARESESAVHHETVWVGKRGGFVAVSVTLSAVRDPEGRPAGFSVIARDVTEERRMAAELDATLAALDEAVSEAREAAARGRDFLADAAHQLRTPTAGIRACAEALLRHPSFPPEAEGVIAEMLSETSRAARLIGSLLQMARLDQGGAVTPSPCDIVQVCEEEAERARSLAPSLEIHVGVRDLPEEKPELDADAVREILANVLDNARRHAVSRVELMVATVADRIEISVHDDGPGVPNGMVNRVFDRFATLDGKGGSGLGLPIARGLARAHGGDLTYEARNFVLRLPARTDERQRVDAS